MAAGISSICRAINDVEHVESYSLHCNAPSHCTVNMLEYSDNNTVRLARIHRVHRRRIKTEENAKGRRCCLGDRIGSIPCRASHFAPGQFEEKNELHQDDMKIRMINPYLQIIPVQN